MNALQQRLLAAALLSCAACDAAPAPAPPAAGRVEAVVAAKKPERDLAEFCDVHAGADAAKTLSLPPTDTPPKGAAGKPRWVNLWATWCKPCLEEMPRLSAFQKRLADDGSPIALSFISADEDVEALAAHLSAHPELPPTTHMMDPSGLKPWLAEIGLDPGAGLPVHVLTDERDRVRCVRAGGVNDDHYAYVADVFAQR